MIQCEATDENTRRRAPDLNRDDPRVFKRLPGYFEQQPLLRVERLGFAGGDPKELGGAIERAFSSGVPALINVVTDPNAVSGATYSITEMMMSVNKK